MQGNKTEGYLVKPYGKRVKRYCQTLDLKDDKTLIEKYKSAHARENFWPEIMQGIKQVGILDMDIYILDTRLFMIVETDLNFNWQQAMQTLSTLPRQQEWEDFVALFQQSPKGASSDEKWRMMERMFHLYE